MNGKSEAYSTQSPLALRYRRAKEKKILVMGQAPRGDEDSVVKKQKRSRETHDPFEAIEST
jgi:hypothetical protein